MKQSQTMLCIELAHHLTNQLFSLGIVQGVPVQRIQFLGGTYPDNEIPQGGMNKEALLVWMIKELIDYYETDDEQPPDTLEVFTNCFEDVQLRWNGRAPPFQFEPFNTAIRAAMYLSQKSSQPPWFTYAQLLAEVKRILSKTTVNVEHAKTYILQATEKGYITTAPDSEEGEPQS